MSRGAQIKFALVLVLLVLLVVVGLQNRTSIEVRLLFWTVQMSGAFLYSLLLLSGMVLGMVLSWLLRRQKESAPAGSGV